MLKMNIFLTSFEALTGLSEIIAYLFVFVFGSIVGSFLNVVIHRVPNEQSIVFPNSACPNCKSPIKAYDNIPILSWLILSGKCRTCREIISYRYPAVEALTGLLFLMTYLQIGLNPFLPVCLIFISVLIALMFIDAGHMILPNVITYPLLIFTLLIRVIYPLVFDANYFSDMAFAPAASLADYPAWLVSFILGIIGALAGGGSLWLVGEIWKRLRGVDAMGLGDVKMMLGVGALLGWRLSFVAIFLAAFSGALIGVVLIAKQKQKDFQTQVPFGIFLGIGSILALFFGEQMIAWYIRNFLP